MAAIAYHLSCGAEPIEGVKPEKLNIYKASGCLIPTRLVKHECALIKQHTKLLKFEGLEASKK